MFAYVRPKGTHVPANGDVPPELPGLQGPFVDMEVVVMSMTLHRLDRKEILNELHWIGERMNYPKSEIISVNRYGIRTSIVKVEEKANGVFLFPFEAGSPLIRLAPFMGSKMHDYDIGDLVSELEECTHDDVWLQWPADEPHTVVGKILGVGHGDTLTVNLTPVPKDIEEVNRLVHGKVIAAGCETARSGTQCGDCPMLSGCGILEKVDKEITDERDGRTEGTHADVP